MPKSVLAADDSVTIRKVLGMLFASEDVSLTLVDNGTDAVTQALQLSPALILLDCVMPGKNGYEACEAIRQQMPQVPILLLSGNSEPFDENRARSAGANGSLSKPFDSTVFIDRVRRALGVESSISIPAATQPGIRSPMVAPPAAQRPAPGGPAPMMPQRPAGVPMAVPSGNMPPRPMMSPQGMPRPQPGAMPPGAPHPQMMRPPPPGMVPGQPIPMNRPVMGRPPGPMPGPQMMRPPGPQMMRPPPQGVPPGQPMQRRDPYGLGPAPAPAPRDGGEAHLRQALSMASREVIEKIAWEVVPQLAEVIIREQVERLVKERDLKS
jgi:CheY-like chemotaxis protein